MRKAIFTLALLGVLSVISMNAAATGLVAMPNTGFSGSAYTLCNTTGNFGSSIATQPTVAANNICAVFPGTEITYPGYGTVVATSRPAIINGITVGIVTDRVLRNAANTSCLFVTRFNASAVDWDPNKPGTQYFVVNDIARGGFGSGSVNAGYYAQAANSSPVYRIGRTFTSVQHRALKYDTAANRLLLGTNYLDLPTANEVDTALSGEVAPINASTAASTTAATQDAVVDSNWIDFTLNTTYQGRPVSSVTYIEAACDGTAVSGWVKPGAIRLRQTGQEDTTMQEINIDGYAPPGATLP